MPTAAANLRALWAAERVYWLEYHAFTTDYGRPGPLGSSIRKSFSPPPDTPIP